jgi:integrase
MVALERQVMACIARMFGGLRTGDLHALDWSTLDSEGGASAWGWAPRQKAGTPWLLEIPELLRPILRDRWERTRRKKAAPCSWRGAGKRGRERSRQRKLREKMSWRSTDALSPAGVGSVARVRSDEATRPDGAVLPQTRDAIGITSGYMRPP